MAIRKQHMDLCGDTKELNMNANVEKVLNHLFKNAQNTSRPKKADAVVYKTPESGNGLFKMDDIAAIKLVWSDQYKNWFVDVLYVNQENNAIVGFKLPITEKELDKWFARIREFATRNDSGDDDLDEVIEPTVEATGSEDVVNELDVDIVADAPKSIGSEIDEIVVCDKCASKDCIKDPGPPFGGYYICNDCGNSFQKKL